jgi:hypothetical protein
MATLKLYTAALAVLGGVIMASGIATSVRAELGATPPPVATTSTPPTIDGTANAPGQAPGGAQTSDGKPDPNEVICKRVGMTGTRVSRQKICMTRADWEQDAEESEGAAKDMRSQSGGDAGRNGSMPGSH